VGLRRSWRYGTAYRAIILGALLFLLSSLSCDEPFDPKASLDHQMVLYAILSTDRAEQYVRVEQDYMPEGSDPNQDTANTALSDVIVTLKEPARLYRFRDTVLSRQDTSRYRSPMQMYVLSPFTPEHGKSYNVLAQSRSMGMAYSTVVMPYSPVLNIASSTWILLQDPITHSPGESIQFSAQLAWQVKGYVARLYLYYDVLKGSEWVEERVELPIGTWNPERDYYGLDLLYYPQMTASSLTGAFSVTYKNGFLQSIIKQLTTKRYASNKIIYKWVVFDVLQADQNLYDYYTSVQEYRDPRSIRLDEPMYSRVNGGLGFAGAYTLDSLLYVLPENFPGNRQ
jgi:hypothetical protein